jgi:hypothetical protein
MDAAQASRSRFSSRTRPALVQAAKQVGERAGYGVAVDSRDNVGSIARRRFPTARKRRH